MNTPSIKRIGIQQSSGENILLNETKVKRRIRTTLVEVNSRDRNIVSYPNSSKFRWNLLRPLKDVKEIRLVGGTIPTRIYNISNGWNTFTLTEHSSNLDISGTQYNIILTPGRYCDSEIALELQLQLNKIPNKLNTYYTMIIETTKQLTIITEKNGYKFKFLLRTGQYTDLYDENNTLTKINTPAKLLGFSRADYVACITNNNVYIIISPFSVDTAFLLNRMYLFINHENNQDMGTVERSIGKKNPYSIIYIDTTSDYKTFNRDTMEFTYSSSPAPIARLANLDINICDEFDRNVFFNGRDLTLLLEITHLE